MKKLLSATLFALLLLSFTGNCSAADGDSVLAMIIGTKAPKLIEVGGGFGLGSNATSSWEGVNPTYQPLLQYFKVNNLTALGATVDLGVNVTSKISVNSQYVLANAGQSIDIYGSSPQHIGELSVNSSPSISLDYTPVSLWGFGPYLGIGWRHLFMTGPADYVANTTLEGDSNWLYEAGVKSPVFWGWFIGSVDYKRTSPVNLDTAFAPIGHLKTSLGADFISVSVRATFF